MFVGGLVWLVFGIFWLVLGVWVGSVVVVMWLLRILLVVCCW